MSAAVSDRASRGVAADAVDRFHQEGEHQNVGIRANENFQFVLDKLVCVGDNGIEIGAAAPDGIAVGEDCFPQEAGGGDGHPAKVQEDLLWRRWFLFSAFQQFHQNLSSIDGPSLRLQNCPAATYEFASS
jgi:hypothetical protein